MCRFGEILEKLLGLRAISGRELGRLSGLPSSSISHYMVGRQTPSRSSTARMAKALDVPACLLAWFAHTNPSDNDIYKQVEEMMQDYLQFVLEGQLDGQRA